MEYQKITRLHNRNILFSLKKNYFILKNKNFFKSDVLKLLVKVYIRGLKKLDFNSYEPELYNFKKKIFRIRPLKKKKNLGTDLFLNKFEPVPLYYNRFIRELSWKKKLFVFSTKRFNKKVVKNWRVYFKMPLVGNSVQYKREILFMLTHLSPVFQQYSSVLSTKKNKRYTLLGSFGSYCFEWSCIDCESTILMRRFENTIKNKENFDWYYTKEINLKTNKVLVPGMDKFDVEEVLAISKRYLRNKLLNQLDPGLFTRDRSKPLSIFFLSLMTVEKNYFMVELINQIVRSRRNNFIIFDWKIQKNKKIMDRKKKMLNTYNNFINDINSK